MSTNNVQMSEIVLNESPVGMEAGNADPETELLLKEVRGLLAKITPQTFDDVCKELLELEPRMNTVERCTGVVEIVFQKAIGDPETCAMCTDLCDRLIKVQLPRQNAMAGRSAYNTENVANFKRALLNKCQGVVDQYTKSDETKGNMRFIGELYNRAILTAEFMHFCVSSLLCKVNDDPSVLESLHTLLTVIAKKFHADKYGDVNGYYVHLESLAQNHQLSNRYRLMISHLLVLRKEIEHEQRAVSSSLDQEQDHDQQADNADPETQELLKEVRSLLKKITPQTFDELSKQFLELEPRMNTVERCTGIVEIMFQKAVGDPRFCTMYADLFDRLIKVQTQRRYELMRSSTFNTDTDNTLYFRRVLVNKCQKVFNQYTKSDEATEKEMPELKNQLQADLDKIAKERRQSLGNIRFMGELYLRNMLTAKIMHFCVSSLLRKVNDDPEALEPLCKLLCVIGKKLENDQKMSRDARMDVNGYYAELESVAQSQQPTCQYRFLILDLLDLRKNGWDPRKKPSIN